MADYSDFMSMGTTYELSKGPKSLYYGKGDEDLFALVLNVPQQDDDDEWGGTERIALERIADGIGSLQEIVSDPAGSTNGLVQKVAALETIVHTTVPEIVLGDITVSGSTNSITIGSDALLDGESLGLGGALGFLIDKVDAQRYQISYGTGAATYIRMLNGGGAWSITLGTGTKTYVFSDTGFTVPAITISGDLNVSGDVNGTNGVFSGDIVADEITAATINATALVAGTATICGNLTTRDVAPDVASTRNIGLPGNRYNGIAARDLNLSDVSGSTFAVDGTTGNLVSSGDITTTGNISAAIITATTHVRSDLIRPNTITGALGMNVIPPIVGRWANIWGGDADLMGSLHTTGDIYTTAWTDYSSTSTITGWSSFTVQKIYYKKVGDLGVVEFLISGTSNAATASFTLPVALTAKNVSALTLRYAIGITDSGTPAGGLALIDPNTVIVYCSKTFNVADYNNWTASAAKTVGGVLVFQTE